MWFAFNTLVTIKKIEKLTQVGDSKKPINSLSLGLYFILFVIGPFGFFFIKKIKKIRYEKYLKDKLFYYNWSNTSPLTPLGKKIFKDINRQLKLIKLEREARINKIKHLINPFK
jgi:hypothetical protein